MVGEIIIKKGDGEKVVVEITPLRAGVISHSGKSKIMASTSGFVRFEKMMLSLNLIQK